MKAIVYGVKLIKGDKAKSSGNPYEMCRLFVGGKIQPVSKPGMTIQGAGFEPVEVNLDPLALPAFLALEGKYPVSLDLKTDSVPMFGKFETIVVGIDTVPTLKTANG